VLGLTSFFGRILWEYDNIRAGKSVDPHPPIRETEL
jgi:hypothetical protein